jgi:hypothetical protein
MNECIKINIIIPDEMSGKRLDQALAELLPEHSRARLQGWIHDDYVQIDKKSMRPRDKVHGGEQVEIRAEIESQISASPEDIPLEIVFEDEHLSRRFPVQELFTDWIKIQLAYWLSHGNLKAIHSLLSSYKHAKFIENM